MQTTANITRFITGNSSRSGFADLKSLISAKGSFRQRLIEEFTQAEYSKNLFLALANRFISFSEQAYIQRDVDSLEQASLVLINLPLSEAQQIGLYYQALSNCRKDQKDEARVQVERIVDTAPLTYRSRAILTLGTFYHDQGKFDEALRFYIEASKVALSWGALGAIATLRAEQNVAFILSDLGDHNRSLSKLESLWPLVQFLAKQNPFYLHLYHNAVAVELAALGRFDEAQAASEIALTSPFAPVYPEWSETREEISQKRVSRWSNLPVSPQSFLAAESNSFSNQDSQTAANSETEAEAKPQVKKALATKRLRVVAFYLQNRKYNFQIPSGTIPTKALAVNPGSAQSILERLGESIRPRGPPCCF